MDIIVVQGWEAGRHICGGVATRPLVPAVLGAMAPELVIAAGGIGDARGVAQCSPSARRPPCSARGSGESTKCRSTASTGVP